MTPDLRRRLLAVAASLAMIGGGTATYVKSQKPSAAVVLAHEMGAYFESSGRHIGVPYVDKLGKGQPLTVCNGVTGPDVVAGRYYSPEDCKRLEIPRYRDAERWASREFRFWASYNVWVQASILDMVYNLGAAQVAGSTMFRLANAGDLDGACAQMPRWVFGTVNGQRTALAGLMERRESTREICAEWGRDGHFSAGLIAGSRQ